MKDNSQVNNNELTLLDRANMAPLSENPFAIKLREFAGIFMHGGDIDPNAAEAD